MLKTAPSKPLQAALFVALLALSAIPRLVGLAAVPPGPAFVESAMVSQAETLVEAPYAAHMTNGHTPYPSLVFYEGLASAQWLGWEIRSFRLPAALWGILSVLAFYFLLCRAASPTTAFLFAALFSVNNLHLGHSRQFYPGTIVYFAVAAGAALLWVGLERGRWPWFLLAGLAAGMGMHGYVPGRLVLPVLALWLAYACRRPQPVLWFLLGGLLMASPVLWWMARDWGAYWGTVHHFGAGSPFASLIAYWQALPSYLAMPFTQPDGLPYNSDGMALFPLLRADPLTMVLLPAGLALALWRPRQHLSWLIVLGLFLGIVPAAIASGQPHPSTRRALLALPFIYLAAATAWQAAAAWASSRPAWLRRSLTALGWSLAAFSVAFSLHQYFSGIMGDPRVRRSYSAGASILTAELQAHPSAAVTLSNSLASPGTAALVYYRDKQDRFPKRVQNFLVLPLQRPIEPRYAKGLADQLVPKGGGEQLLLMDPFFRLARPLIERLYPGADIRSWSDPILPAPSLGSPDGAYLQRVLISPQAVAAAQGLRDLSAAPWAPGSLLSAWDPAFAVARHGQRLALGALLVLGEAPGPWTFTLAWPGWSLRLDGRPAPLGKPLALAPGTHALELRGAVPAQAAGALPLRIVSSDGQAVAPAELLAVDPRLGFLAKSQQGAAAPLWSVEPLPYRRYEAPEAVGFPYQVEWTGLLQAPKSGLYQLRMPGGLPTEITLGRPGVTAKPAGSQTVCAPVQLTAGKPMPLRLSFKVEEHLWLEWSQNVVLEVKTPGSDDFEPLPFDWVWLPQSGPGR